MEVVRALHTSDVVADPVLFETDGARLTAEWVRRVVDGGGQIHIHIHIRITPIRLAWTWT